jgi:predicted GNAT family acetyltransferase
VARGILERGELPVLHVAEGNDPAERVYERLGFSRRSQVHFALLHAPPA